jgi:hypothetical protein
LRVAQSKRSEQTSPEEEKLDESPSDTKSEKREKSMSFLKRLFGKKRKNTDEEQMKQDLEKELDALQVEETDDVPVRHTFTDFDKLPLD